MQSSDVGRERLGSGHEVSWRPSGLRGQPLVFTSPAVIKFLDAYCGFLYVGENRGCGLAFGRLNDTLDSSRLGASHRVPLKEGTLEKSMISAPIIGYSCLDCARGLQDCGRSRAKEGGRDGPNIC